MPQGLRLIFSWLEYFSVKKRLFGGRMILGSRAVFLLSPIVGDAGSVGSHRLGRTNSDTLPPWKRCRLHHTVTQMLIKADHATLISIMGFWGAPGIYANISLIHLVTTKGKLQQLVLPSKVKPLNKEIEDPVSGRPLKRSWTHCTAGHLPRS